jgi:hypothetical protein
MPGVRVVDLSGDETVIGIIELCDPRRELGPEQQFIDFWTSARSAIDAFLAVHSSAFIFPQPSTHTRVKRERNNQNIPPISDSPPTSQTCSLGSRPEDGECGGETERGRVGGGVRGSYEGPAPGGARNHGKRRNRGGGHVVMQQRGAVKFRRQCCRRHVRCTARSSCSGRTS